MHSLLLCNAMNTTALTPQQLADLKREYVQLMLTDMSSDELFEYATNKALADVALLKQDQLKAHIEEYDDFAYEVLEDYVTDTVGSYEIYQEFMHERHTNDWIDN